MGTGSELVKSNARRKGWAAPSTGIVTAATAAAAFSVGLPFIGGVALVAGGLVTGQKLYEWLKYRGTWGMRF